MQAQLPASISASSFVTCWVIFDKGKFVLGIGQPGKEPCFSWNDAEPVPGIKHVGLGSWDKHVCFRNISIRPAPALGRGQELPVVQAVLESYHLASHISPDLWCTKKCFHLRCPSFMQISFRRTVLSLILSNLARVVSIFIDISSLKRAKSKMGALSMMYTCIIN